MSATKYVLYVTRSDNNPNYVEVDKFPQKFSNKFLLIGYLIEEYELTEDQISAFIVLQTYKKVNDEYTETYMSLVIIDRDY